MNQEEETAPRSWELPDAMWQRVETLIPPRKSRLGRPRSVDFRRISEGIFYVLRTGIQWRAVPRERFGPVHLDRYPSPYSEIPKDHLGGVGSFLDDAPFSQILDAAPAPQHHPF